MNGTQISQAWPRRQQRAYISRLWRGEIPLAKTYWFWSFAIGITLRLGSFGVTYLTVRFGETLGKVGIYSAIYGWLAFVYAYSCFMIVATWRSARRYKIEFPSRKRWGRLAQAVAALGVVTVVVGLARNVVFQLYPTLYMKYKFPTVRLDREMLIKGLNSGLPKRINSTTELDQIDIDGNVYVYKVHVITSEGNRDRILGALTEKLCASEGIGDILRLGYGVRVEISDQVGPLGSTVLEAGRCSTLQ